MLKLEWIKCGTDGHWCSFEHLDLPNLGAVSGVYVIWHEGAPGRVVRVGQGNITDRLASHRNDRSVMDCKRLGNLRVTWAAVPARLMDGIERYLADEWNPLVGDAFPDVQPVAVNSPW